MCLQFVEGHSGAAQGDKPIPEQWFENAHGAAEAMKGSVISIEPQRAASLQERKHVMVRRIERNLAEQ